MTVTEAREIAREWVREEGAKTPGCTGAFCHGSVTWLPDDATLPETSDVDVMLVVAEEDPREKRGKFRWRGVLLEVSYLPADLVASPERVLSNYHLAGSLRVPSVLHDPFGTLVPLQAAVAAEFAKREWVIRRCEHARDNARNMLKAVDASAPLHDQVMPWLFGTGVTTHVLLVAGLRNPTVRRRYLDARQLLADYGLSDFYPALLELLGCARMSRERAERHLAAVADAFDTAKSVLKTPYRFSADVTEAARPVAIDGSREMIERGDHREAVFWMLATYSRCRWVLTHDAPAEIVERHDLGYREFLADLGITSFDDLRRRSEEAGESLPRVWEVALAIVAANPQIDAP